MYRNHVEAAHGDVPTVANVGLVDAWSQANIGDLVWEDLDDNGIQDLGEPGMAGVTVSIGGTDRWGAPVSLTATTDTDGRWSLDVPPGDYQLALSNLPEGYRVVASG